MSATEDILRERGLDDAGYEGPYCVWHRSAKTHLWVKLYGGYATREDAERAAWQGTHMPLAGARPLREATVLPEGQTPFELPERLAERRDELAVAVAALLQDVPKREREGLKHEILERVSALVAEDG